VGSELNGDGLKLTASIFKNRRFASQSLGGHMSLSRRSFLKGLFVATAAAALPLTALSAPIVEPSGMIMEHKFIGRGFRYKLTGHDNNGWESTVVLSMAEQEEQFDTPIKIRRYLESVLRSQYARREADSLRLNNLSNLSRRGYR
jgi:hypothetical protein